MTTRSHKRKAVAELVSGDFETSINGNFPSENLVASSSKVPRIKPESLTETKTSLRKEIMSDLTKILAENQKEMLKLIAPLNKKQTVHMNVQDSDSEPENVSVTRTSTPVKIHTATNPKTTPINSRNRRSSVFSPEIPIKKSSHITLHLVSQRRLNRQEAVIVRNDAVDFSFFSDMTIIFEITVWFSSFPVLKFLLGRSGPDPANSPSSTGAPNKPISNC